MDMPTKLAICIVGQHLILLRAPQCESKDVGTITRKRGNIIGHPSLLHDQGRKSWSMVRAIAGPIFIGGDGPQDHPESVTL